MVKWTRENIPSLKGKVAVVTGANSGIGFEVALTLAKSGAEVVLACRNEAKAGDAFVQILKENPNAAIRTISLDLTSLKSIRAFAKEFGQSYDHLDLLINNAGVMALPERKMTEDGFEFQFGTNHLGHYALTSMLLKHLASSPKIPRVVTVSSRKARSGKVNFDDLMQEKKYSPIDAYAQSKLANLLFALELQRQSEAFGWGIISIAAHPGFSRTNLFKEPGFYKTAIQVGGCCSQSAEKGALPILYAAISEDAEPGGYYGPNHCFELKGGVGRAFICKRARDMGVAKRLWDVSASLTGVEWPEAIDIVGSEDADAHDRGDVMD